MYKIHVIVNLYFRLNVTKKDLKKTLYDAL